ncbi:hypothetical protein DSO57_1030262 [Entomophthora muscae]|uniref:Uncharacterized protein n=1 Tax=Entomophthora muscae TaxID=34485 RepID=A0ACC2RFR8_9FUNG|nr:hypothetical protein DSO57_1030262 [Entomophthora muscae]
MDLLDAKVQKILAQVSLEEELPHYTPNVERYMGFSPPTQNKVTVETVEVTLKKAHQPDAPLSPLIFLAPVDNPPMETEEDWACQATPEECEEVQLLQDIIANNNCPISLPKNGSSMKKLVEVTQAAKKLLEETKIEMAWAQFFKYCPQFCTALKQAVLDTFTKKKPKQLLASVGAPQTLGTIDSVPTTIILDGGSYTNIATKRFLDHLGITDITPIKNKYILADGRQAPCISTVHGLQVQIDYVGLYIDVTVFDHCQFNFLMGCKLMKDFCIITHYKTYLWAICQGVQCAELEVSYSKEVDFICPSFNSDPFCEAYLCTTMVDNLDKTNVLTPLQTQQLHRLLDRFNECIVEDLD